MINLGKHVDQTILEPKQTNLYSIRILTDVLLKDRFHSGNSKLYVDFIKHVTVNIAPYLFEFFILIYFEM